MARPPMPDDFDQVQRFVTTVLSVSDALYRSLSMLLEDLPENTVPGETPAAVVIEMVTGTFRPAAEAAGPEALAQAEQLVSTLHDRFVWDLRRAREMAEELEEAGLGHGDQPPGLC